MTLLLFILMVLVLVAIAVVKRPGKARDLWLRICRFFGICTDKIMRRPPPPRTPEEAAIYWDDLLAKARRVPKHPVGRRFAGGHEMKLVIPPPDDP